MIEQRRTFTRIDHRATSVGVSLPDDETAYDKYPGAVRVAIIVAGGALCWAGIILGLWAVLL